jgi:hypothetical protein
MNEADFVRAYPTTSNADLAAQFGVSPITIQKWAAQRGLKKAPEYRSGVQQQNAGKRKVSAGLRERLRAKALGRNVSPETRAKLSEVLKASSPKGERHYKWKGGKPWKRFTDPRYVAWRTAVLERDAYICQHCHRTCNKNERGLAAHHIKPYATHPELRYDVANGITLCRQCHLQLHGRAPKPKERIPCACGCGTLIEPIDRYGRSRRYALYHPTRRGVKMAESTKQKLREQRQNIPLTSEHRAKIAHGLRTTTKRIGRPPRRSQTQ